VIDYKYHFARLLRNIKATNGWVVMKAINILKTHGNNWAKFTDQ